MLRVVASVTALTMMVPVFAQVRPDAGATQRDLEQRRLDVPRATPPLATEPARPALQADDTQRFIVTGLKVSGNSAFAAETLLALVRSDLMGKSVTLKQLQEAAAKITEYYRAQGYLVARAYIPQQSIEASGAEIEIAILEGVLGRLRIDNRSRLSEATVARFAAPLKQGVPLTLNTFERPILLLSDQAGVGGVNPVLGAGEVVGASDLTLELAPARVVTGQLEIDNQGNRFTGAHRLTGQFNLASPLGLGESLTARLTESFEGLTSASIRGAIPLGGDGWKLGASYSDTRYQLGKNFAALGASGDSTSTGAQISYPLVRSQRWNLNASLGVEDKSFADRVASTASATNKSSHSASVTLSGDLRDPFAANSVLVWSAGMAAGNVSLDDPATRAADAASAMTQGAYRKHSLSLLYLHALNRDWTFYGSATAQAAGKNLDSSEKFSLGGAQGVRAYPSGEAAGDEGLLASLELRYALSQWLGAAPSLVLFLDSGRTRVNKNQFAAGVNERRLGAAGVGLTLVKSQDFSVRAYWALKTMNAVATADNDRNNRAWVQAVKYF